MTQYIPIANRLRPISFDKVIYNEPVVTVLAHLVASQRYPNAIVLSGTRGVGKTSLARIFARAINCEAQKGYNPCNECSSCKSSLVGKHPDILEIDGASHGNIDDIRDIIERAYTSPMVSPYKIIIIDEAHNLGRSQASWDALLKIMEEPPAHLLWVLCTTQRAKIPDVIRSRAMCLELRMVPTAVLDSYLREVIAKETNVDPNTGAMAAGIIARLANNSIRDSLNILEKVIPYCNSVGWSKNTVQEAAGTFDVKAISQMINAIAFQNSAELWSIMNGLVESGIDSSVIINSLSEAVTDLISLSLRADVHNKELYEAIPKERMPDNRLVYLSDVILKRSADISMASNKKLILQLLSLELCF